MGRSLLTAGLLLVAFSVVAAAASSNWVEIGVKSYDFESSKKLTTHKHWVLHPTDPTPDPTRVLEYHFALEPRNMNQIHSIAADVSDPRSPNYGRHLNGQQIADIVSPPQSEIDTVTGWLRASGVSHELLTTRHMIRARASVAQWQSLLRCQLRTFITNLDTRSRAGSVNHGYPRAKPKSVIRKVGSHWLPADVAAVVKHISGLTDTPLKRKGIRRDTDMKSPAKLPTAELKQQQLQSSKAGPAIKPASFGNCPALLNSTVAHGGDAAFYILQATNPSPATGFQFSAYLKCKDGTLSSGVANNGAGSYTGSCGPNHGPNIEGVSVTITLTDPFGLNLGSTPAAVIMSPTSCQGGLTSVGDSPFAQGGICNWVTGVLIPNSMGVSIAMTITYGDQSTVTSYSGSQACWIQPGWSISTPQFLSQQYNLPLRSRAHHPLTSQSIYANGDNYDKQDIADSGAGFGIEMGKITFDVDNNNTNPAGGEASLDVQIMMSQTRNVSQSWFWNLVVDPSFAAVTGAILNDLGGTPLVLSISYGGEEGPDGPNSPDESVAANNMAMIATTNHTLITASGDNGAMGNGCDLTPDNPTYAACSQCCLPENIAPEFPSSSPYVVAVGATQIGAAGWNNLLLNQLGILSPVNSEIACSSATQGVITTGGGYSAMYPALSYQFDALAGYLEQAGSSSPAWIPEAGGVQMRGYPDVAMSGAYFPVFINGTMQVEFGTSASTPLFASVVTLLNDARLRNGLPPMGHILPFLYYVGKHYPDAFYDIVAGTNTNANPSNGGPCDFPVTCTGMGLSAAVGWDALTGLGSPRFDRLLAYALEINADYNLNADRIPATFNEPKSVEQSRIISIVAIVIAIVAVFVSIWAIHAVQTAAKANGSVNTTGGGNRNVPFLPVDN